MASPITTRLQKKSNNKQTHIGDIQEYLSPESQFGPVSLSQVVQEGKKNSMSRETDSNDIKSPKCQGTKIERCQRFLLEHALKFKNKMQSLQ